MHLNWIRNFEESDTERVLDVYKSAMSTPPWSEDIPLNVLATEFAHDRGRLNFMCRVYEDKIEGIIWALWHEEVTIPLLSEERWADLVNEIIALWIDGRIGWFRDLVIGEHFQSKWIWKQLLMDAITVWREQWYQRVVLRIHLWWLWNDISPNIKAIKLYEWFGFTLLNTREIIKDSDQNTLSMGYMQLTL